jgi:hypothetical protein
MYALLNSGLVVETSAAAVVGEFITGNRFKSDFSKDDMKGDCVSFSGLVIEVMDWVYPTAILEV